MDSSNDVYEGYTRCLFRQVILLSPLEYESAAEVCAFREGFNAPISDTSSITFIQVSLQRDIHIHDSLLHRHLGLPLSYS